MGTFLSDKHENRSSFGFTIVELLIVVVVIAILAAITIVAYNGVTSRAKISAAQTAAESASKKVLTYATINGDQLPTDLATAGITDSGSTTYQYSSNTAVTPQTFCVTATVSNVSYYIDNTSHTNPTAGGCPGHAQNGGVAITNLAKNPRCRTSGAGWYASNNGGTYSSACVASGGPDGGSFFRETITAVSATASPYNSFRQEGNVALGPLQPQAGQPISVTLWTRASQPRSLRVSLIGKLADGSGWNVVGTGTASLLVAGQWTKLSISVATWPAGAGYSMLQVVNDVVGANSLNWVIGDTIDTTMLMVTQGSTNIYDYADPVSSSSWIWNGTTDASTSTGPAL